MFNLRYIFIGPMLEKENQRLTENLVREQRDREADRRAWDRRFSDLQRQMQARLDALTDQMLLMAGVPKASGPVEVEQYETAKSPPAAIPGAASYELDLFLEQREDEELKRYWQSMQEQVATEDVTQS